MDNQRHVIKNCPYCGDVDGSGAGYLFDSLVACTRCDAGKTIQNGYDVAELAKLQLRVKWLRWNIEDYQAAQLKKLSQDDRNIAGRTIPVSPAPNLPS